MREINEGKDGNFINKQHSKILNFKISKFKKFEHDDLKI
jgi:hypothetical protein